MTFPVNGLRRKKAIVSSDKLTSNFGFEENTMKQSVFADRALSALDESRSTNEAGARAAGQKRDAVSGVVEINARQRGENSVPAELNETLTRAHNLLDQNRNYRQISILLTYRGIQLMEECQMLMKQSLEFQGSIWASCQETVARSFALLSHGRKQDSNEP